MESWPRDLGGMFNTVTCNGCLSKSPFGAMPINLDGTTQIFLEPSTFIIIHEAIIT
jgi:hypothetical protein